MADVSRGVAIPARAFGRTVPIGAELLVAQLSSGLRLFTAPGVIPFVAETAGVVIPMVDLHERVPVANGQHKFSQGDRVAYAPAVPLYLTGAV